MITCNGKNNLAKKVLKILKNVIKTFLNLENPPSALDPLALPLKISNIGLKKLFIFVPQADNVVLNLVNVGNNVATHDEYIENGGQCAVEGAGSFGGSPFNCKYNESGIITGSEDPITGSEDPITGSADCEVYNTMGSNQQEYLCDIASNPTFFIDPKA